MKTSCRSSALLRKGGDYLNVTINRAEMLSAIKRASAIAPADSPLDVLRGALLEADAAAGKLTVTSTNLEAALEEKLPCTVQEDGALVFGAKMLAEMLSRLPQDTVQLCRAENQGRMTLRSGDACYEVDVWERGAFPKPDLPFPEDTVKLSGIPAMAQHTVFATAQDNSKPLLKCVNLMFTSTGLRAAGPPPRLESSRICARTRMNSASAPRERASSFSARTSFSARGSWRAATSIRISW